MKRTGVLLVNLGSPDSPSVPDVRKYLRQFLMDGRVLDTAFPIRFCVVHFAILPRRPKQSAEAYEKIWLKEGSPLVVTSRHLAEKIRTRLGSTVELAMRYQNPSIEEAVGRLRSAGVEEVVLVPLFPHYAMSSYETAVERVKQVMKERAPAIALKVTRPYYEDAGYVDALVASATEYLAREHDHLLFSFHGLPERHMRKADPTRSHCLEMQNCCDVASPAHATCYRAQCFKTVKAFVAKAGVREGKFSVSFQSRLGREPWLQPYTDVVVASLPARGIRRLLVICPAFVCDCLETLEEIGMRAKEDFLAAGGEDLTLIPCLNEHPRWLDALEDLVRKTV